MMISHTCTIVLDATKAETYEFVSKISNLPIWATAFCRGLRCENGEFKVITPAGEIFFRIEAEAASGIVDMFGGPAPETMAYWPARVVELPGRRSAFIFTLFQWPGMSDADFTQQHHLLEGEFENLSACLKTV